MGEAIKAEPQNREAEALLREFEAVAENITGAN
jgi:hypothetical protein